MSRRVQPRKPARGTPKEPRRRILVVTEGEKTEPDYLEGYKKHVRNPLVDVKVEGRGATPSPVVGRAIELKKEAEKKAKKERDGYQRYDQVWCVFDVDEHKDFDKAKNMAKSHDIDLAISNPCFELWLYLHAKDPPGQRGRQDLQRMVEACFPGYDSENNKTIPFEKLKDAVPDACSRAKRLADGAAKMSEPGRNPTTDVFLLIEAMKR